MKMSCDRVVLTNKQWGALYKQDDLKVKDVCVDEPCDDVGGVSPTGQRAASQLHRLFQKASPASRTQREAESISDNLKKWALAVRRSRPPPLMRGPRSFRSSCCDLNEVSFSIKLRSVL